jgi:hypothetical protein
MEAPGALYQGRPADGSYRWLIEAAAGVAMAAW